VGLPMFFAYVFRVAAAPSGQHVRTDRCVQTVTYDRDQLVAYRLIELGTRLQTAINVAREQLNAGHARDGLATNAVVDLGPNKLVQCGLIECDLHCLLRGVTLAVGLDGLRQPRQTCFRLHRRLRRRLSSAGPDQEKRSSYSNLPYPPLALDHSERFTWIYVERHGHFFAPTREFKAEAVRLWKSGVAQVAFDSNWTRARSDALWQSLRRLAFASPRSRVT
jgi:hypothetical protein